MSTDAYELAFPRILEAVAQGASKREALEWLERCYPTLPARTRMDLAADALDQALSCGIEREDVDPSWFLKRAVPISAEIREG